MEAFIRKKEKKNKTVKNETRLYVFIKKYAHGIIMLKKKRDTQQCLVVLWGVGETVYVHVCEHISLSV